MKLIPEKIFTDVLVKCRVHKRINKKEKNPNRSPIRGPYNRYSKEFKQRILTKAQLFTPVELAKNH